jgi:UDP-N-acetylglucosamine 2-epimerase (non-hydrolysing)
MIDTLLAQLEHLRPPNFWKEAALAPQRYFVMTLHRPANVDDPEKLTRLLDAVQEGARGLPVVFPVHPRTRKTLAALPADSTAELLIVEPQPYREFNYLVRHAKAVITDSGGITEETTVMGVPCMTLRDTTERPETVELGTNELLGTDPAALGPAFARIFSNEWKRGQIPEKWDGKAGERIIEHLAQLLPRATD